MAILRKSRSFKDISLSFKPHPVTKDLPVLLNERAIARSVRNLVETVPTERFFDSLIGTNIRESLFDNYSRTTISVIEDQIRETIGNYEPRVNNVRIQADARPDNSAMQIKVLFDIVGLDNPTQSFSFILEPTR